MIRILDLASFAPLLSLKAASLLGFIREPKMPWQPERRPARFDRSAMDPLSLVMLADQKVADGHVEQAKVLVEAAYIVFDKSCLD